MRVPNQAICPALLAAVAYLFLAGGLAYFNWVLSPELSKVARLGRFAVIISGKLAFGPR